MIVSSSQHTGKTHFSGRHGAACWTQRGQARKGTCVGGGGFPGGSVQQTFSHCVCSAPRLASSHRRPARGLGLGGPATVLSPRHASVQAATGITFRKPEEGRAAPTSGITARGRLTLGAPALRPKTSGTRRCLRAPLTLEAGCSRALQSTASQGGGSTEVPPSAPGGSKLADVRTSRASSSPWMGVPAVAGK